MAIGGFMHQKGELHAIAYEPVQLKSINNSGYFSLTNANMYDPVKPTAPIERRGLQEMPKPEIVVEKEDINAIQTQYNQLLSDLDKAKEKLKGAGTAAGKKDWTDAGAYGGTSGGDKKVFLFNAARKVLLSNEHVCKKVIYMYYYFCC